MRQIKNIFILLLFVSSFFDLQGQNYNDTIILLFNKKGPIKADGKNIYYLNDLLATDTLKTTDQNIKISSFCCSTVCSVDLSLLCAEGILTKHAKEYLKDCVKTNKWVYIEMVHAINKNGEDLSLGTIKIFIKINK